MGKRSFLVCATVTNLILLVALAVLIAALVVHITIYPFYQVAAIVWGVSGAALIVIMVYLVIEIVAWDSVDPEKPHTTHCCPCTARILLVLTCICAFVFTFVILGYVVHLNNSSHSSVTAFHLGSYNSITFTQMVFVRNPDASSVRVRWYQDGVAVGNSTQYNPSPSSDYTTWFFLSPLAPDTEYTIRLVVDGAVQSESITFRTLKLPLDPTEVSFSFGSCIFSKWYRSLSRLGYIDNLDPQFVILLGDFIYSDIIRPLSSDQEDYYRAFYRELNGFSNIQSLLSRPAFQMFDDHEFSNNFVGQEGPLSELENALNAWNDYVGGGNPSPRGPAINYYSFTVGLGSFFVLDTRSLRSQPGITNASMIGTQQRQALLSWLLASTTPFKFICTTVPFSRNFISDDGWYGGYREERAIILDFILDNDITGVVFLSGDDHTANALLVEPTLGIYEFSVSPLDGFGPVDTGSYTTSDAVLLRNTQHSSYSDKITYTLDGVTPIMRVQIYEQSNVIFNRQFNLVAGVLVIQPVNV